MQDVFYHGLNNYATFVCVFYEKNYENGTINNNKFIFIQDLCININNSRYLFTVILSVISFEVAV